MPFKLKCDGKVYSANAFLLLSLKSSVISSTAFGQAVQKHCSKLKMKCDGFCSLFGWGTKVFVQLSPTAIASVTIWSGSPKFSGLCKVEIILEQREVGFLSLFSKYFYCTRTDRSHLAVFCTNRNAISCYDFVRIPLCTCIMYISLIHFQFCTGWVHWWNWKLGRCLSSGCGTTAIPVLKHQFFY